MRSKKGKFPEQFDSPDPPASLDSPLWTQDWSKSRRKPMHTFDTFHTSDAFHSFRTSGEQARNICHHLPPFVIIFHRSSSKHVQEFKCSRRGPSPPSSYCLNVSSLAFRQFFNFLDFWAQISELGPQNPSPGRKFYVESDFQVKNGQFRRPEAKN